MDARIIKQGLNRLLSYIPEMLPSMGWYFTDSLPSGAFMPEKNKWTCMFVYIKRLVGGESLCFSAGHTGCSGASCYLGFTASSKEAGRFLAEKEKFKKNATLGNAFYDGICAQSVKAEFVVWGLFDNIADNVAIEVVNLWINADSLSGLVTLANYDRPNNNNVIVPFASGCQSIWTIPYAEKDSKEPKCVVGCIDPAMRKHLPPDILSFAMPANRFVEMTENISGSFLEQNGWNDLMNKDKHNYALQ